MKFGNRFKKQQPLIPHDIYIGGSETTNTEHARGGPSPVGWDHQNEDPPAKKGLHVLKKLNCGAAMNRDRYEENLYPGFNPQHTFRAKPTYVTPPVVQEPRQREPTQQSPFPNSNKKRKDVPILRPVLITVSDGDLGAQQTPNQPEQNADFTSTFLVGPGGTTVDPMKRTVTPEKEERKAKSCVITPRRMQGNNTDPFGEDFNRNCLNRKSPQKESAKESEELQRIARRNRWKRGVARSWKDDGDVSASASGEESTYASSYLTYDSDNDSYNDSYTDGSFESSQWTGYTRRSRKDRRGQRRSKSLSRRKESDSLFDSVAEDLGIVANMLLSDGTSCISGAMDITRETIVSCKQH